MVSGAAEPALSAAKGQRGSGAGTTTLPRWHLWIDEEPRPGWANMAIDLSLLDRAEQRSESWLRLYTWQPYCLSFGRHEPALRLYDMERLEAMGLDLVRRPTGGRAVWHSRELTYAVAAPCESFGSLQDTYLEIHAMLADALRSVGVDASLAPRARPLPLDAGACFAQSAGGEVMATGRKAVGSAQFRRGSALLQHGSILLQDEQQLIAALTKVKAANRCPPIPRASPAILKEALSAAELSEAIAGVSQSRWLGTWHRISKADEILQAASDYFSEFRSPTWTWKR